MAPVQPVSGLMSEHTQSEGVMATVSKRKARKGSFSIARGNRASASKHIVPHAKLPVPSDNGGAVNPFGARDAFCLPPLVFIRVAWTIQRNTTHTTRTHTAIHG